MGDNLWSGLGEMFGFSWHLHFHYPGLDDLSCFPLRINHIPDILSLYPVFVSLSPVSRILHLLAGPGAGDDDGGAPQCVPGRVWVTASVIPSLSANQRPVWWPVTNQRPVSSRHSSPRHVGTQKQSAIDHKQIWPIFIFTKVSKISEIVNKANSYSAIIRLVLLIWLGFSSALASAAGGE